MSASISQRFFNVATAETVATITNAEKIAQLTEGAAFVEPAHSRKSYGRFLHCQEFSGPLEDEITELVLETILAKTIEQRTLAITIDAATLSDKIQAIYTKYKEAKEQKQAESQAVEAHAKMLEQIAEITVYGSGVRVGDERFSYEDFLRLTPADLYHKILKGKDEEIAELKESAEKKDTRISSLASWLERLIMASMPNALERAGLVQHEDEEPERQEPTLEQQEALRKCDLDC